VRHGREADRLLDDDDPFEIDAQAAPGRRRLTATVPVRFPPELLARVRAAAEADDRSISSWIRRAAEHELHPA
jgi:predicted HicB family RNase H-like nuclease